MEHDVQPRFVHRCTTITLLGLCAASLSGAVYARPAEIEGGVTAVYQYADDSRVDDEFVGSLDLVVSVPFGPGVWTLYVEGNSTQRSDMWPRCSVRRTPMQAPRWMPTARAAYRFRSSTTHGRRRTAKP